MNSQAVVFRLFYIYCFCLVCMCMLFLVLCCAAARGGAGGSRARRGGARGARRAAARVRSGARAQADEAGGAHGVRREDQRPAHAAQRLQHTAADHRTLTLQVQQLLPSRGNMCSSRFSYLLAQLVLLKRVQSRSMSIHVNYSTSIRVHMSIISQR